jgi:hypothetical protein
MQVSGRETAISETAISEKWPCAKSKRGQVRHAAQCSRADGHEAKGAGHSRHDQLGQLQQEEPIGCGGERQLSVNGTSRVNRGSSTDL